MQLSKQLRRRRVLVPLSLVAVLVVVRLALPTLLEVVINRQLANLPEYWGQIHDVDLSLWRGAYQIDGLQLYKRNAEHPERPFVQITRADLSVQWGALLEGMVVAEVELRKPEINLVAAKSEEREQVEGTGSLKDTLMGLVPLEINRFVVRGGKVTYLDERKEPYVDLALSEIHLTAAGLQTRPSETKTEDRLPTRIDATGRLQDSGELEARLDLDLFAADHPDFDGTLSMKGLALEELSSFTEAYGKFDFEDGYMAVYGELAARKERVEGYIKPVISNSDVVGEDDDFPEVVWEAFVSGVAELFEGPGTDRLATRIPIEGRLDDPDVGTWTTVGTLVVNGLLKAITPGVENEVSLASIRAGRPSGEDDGA